MNRYFLRTILAAVFVLYSLFLQAQQTPVSSDKFTPGKILIKLRPSSVNIVQEKLKMFHGNNQAETFSTGILHLDLVAHQFKMSKMVRVFPNAGKMEAKQHKYGLDRWYVLQVDQSTAIPAAVNEFKKVSEVETAEPAYKILNAPVTKRAVTAGATNGTPLGTSSTSPPFNDPFYGLQWHYHNTGQTGGYMGADINLETAWKINSGTPNVIVDVVDEGADYKHQDLAANMWVNQAELNGLPGVDDDGNGYVDDIHGYNFADQIGTITAGDHGSHTSGTIAAVNNNGIGVCGIAGGTGHGDGVRIMSSEIFGYNEGSDGPGTAAAIAYGANNGAVISQNSWGYTEPDVYDQAVMDAIDYFIAEAGRDENGNQVGPMNGGVVIFAAGNSNSNSHFFPGYYPNVIAVGATTAYDDRASYSNFGEWVDIAAPGGDENDNLSNPSEQEVVSLFANNSYGYMAGTSMATPHVSGVAALIVSQFGKMGFTNEDLKNRLLQSVDPFIALNPIYNGLMGSGRLDAGKAMQPDNKQPPVAITDLKGISNTPNSINLNWTAPSDPDNVNAVGYIVYYAKHPIDITQKDTIPKIIIKKALTAGSPEVDTLNALVSSTNYYISITAKDLWGNESGFSNVVKVTTKAGPIVSLPVDTIRMSINVITSPTNSTSFVISNKGKAVLNWNAVPTPVNSSWARTDGNFNDTLSLIDAGHYPDDWIGDDQRREFSAATRFDVTKKPFNLTHVASYIHVAGVLAPITIYVYKGGGDPSQGTLLIKQTIHQIDDWEAMFYTKLNGMYLFQPGEWFWVVYQYDPAYGLAQGLEWNAPAAVVNYSLTSSDHGQTWQKLTGKYTGDRNEMLALSDQGYPGAFLSLVPNNGTVAALGSSSVAVNANATTIRNGTYLYNLQINSNDLSNPAAGVPMVITVTGQKGTLTTNQSLLDCRDVFIGKTGGATIEMYNSGLSKLYNFKYSSNNNLFTSGSLPDSLSPGDSAQFTVNFTPKAANQQLAKLQIKTNDGIMNLSASGIGVNPPVMKLSRVPVQIVAKVDSIGKNTFTISNKTGKYPLSYSMPEIAAINKYKAKAKLSKGTDATNAYAWIDSQEPDGPVYSWDDISATGRDITPALRADVKSSKLCDLGFPMKFYGDTIRQIYVNSQGTLTLNYPGAMNDVNLFLPTPGDGINGEIAVCYFEQMQPIIGSTSHIYVQNRPGKFIVQWNDVELVGYGNGDFPSTQSLGKATFQAVLYSNGKIELNYNTVNNTWATFGYAQIGLESKDETKGFSVTGSPNPTDQLFTVMDGASLLFVPVSPSFIIGHTPSSGAVNPGDTVDITVSASAAGLVDSTYQTTIALTTNDPLNEKVDIPVIFTVTGKQSMMLKTPTLAFGTIYKNASLEKDAVFLNAGTKPVKLLSTSISNNAYSTNQDTVTVPAFSELHIPVTFKPTTEGTYPATLTVTTNDAVNPVFKVVLTGSGKATPSLTYSLTGGQTNTLNMGQTNPAVLTVKNTGDADLNIMVERPQWFEMNLAGQGIKNGLDSAHTYSIHNNIDSNSASYNWVELAYGLGTSSYVDPEFIGALPSQPIKLPFAFPFYGKTYTTLYMNWVGDVSTNFQPNTPYIYPTLPMAGLGGYMSSANDALSRGYDWTLLKYIGQAYYYADVDKLIVERYALFSGDNGGGSATVTFETIYYKDGRVKMLYQSGAPPVTSFTQNFLVGIQNEDGTDASLAYNRSIWYINHGVIEFVPSVPVTLKPGASMALPATWTTNDMTDGVYKDNLVLTTNDPRNSSVHIPLELDINGALSMKNTDTVKFGKVVAYLSPVDGSFNRYSQPVSIKNNGTKNIMLNGITFSNPALTLDELNQNPDLFDSPLLLAPGDEMVYHVDFIPDSTMTTFKEKMIVSSDYPTAIKIPVRATVTLPPVVTTDTSYVRFVVDQNDSASKNIQLGNIGKGGLDYSLSIQYHRPGVTYNSAAPAKPVTTGKTANQAHTVYGLGAGETIMGLQGSVLGVQPKFVDSILAFDPTNHTGTWFGSNDPTVQSTYMKKFNGGDKGLYISHVGNLIHTDNLNPLPIKFRIRVGSDVNSTTEIYQQTVQMKGDTSLYGTYLITKLDSAVLIYPNEDFWIEWSYNFFMSSPQGAQEILTEQLQQQTFYTLMADGSWAEIKAIVSPYMAAYAVRDSVGGWLTTSPSKGSVGVKQKQRLVLTGHGPKVAPPDQSVDLLINSNDPVVPVKRVSVFIHINQAPTLSNHDTLRVQEADTLKALIPAVDDGGGPVIFDLIKKDTATSILKKSFGSYFVYRPGYNDAGVHYFPISLADQNGNKRVDTLIVLVINTNRTPYVVRHLMNHRISIQGPALILRLDTVFRDADNDPLIYGYVDQGNKHVKVFVDAKKTLNVIPLDIGNVSLVFKATDPYGANGYDTLHLTIVYDRIPIARHMPNVVIGKRDVRVIDLNSWFSDPDTTDVLKYTAVPLSNGYAELNTQDSSIRITGIQAGSSVVMVTADDGNGGSINDSFLVTVTNALPPGSEIPNVIMDKGATRVLSLDKWFGDAESYSATMDTTTFASMDIAKSDLSLTGLNAGTCLVTITANDVSGSSMNKSFLLSVLNTRGDIVDDYNIKVAPNPIHQDANIYFELGAEKKVRIDLIGMDGKMLSALLEETLAAGNHSVHANFSGIAAGNYLLKFTIDGKVGVVQIAKL